MANKGPTWTGMGRGCGPFKFSEVAGSRGQRTGQGILKRGQGKMSAAHGTNGQSKSNNMNQTVGNSVGSKCRGFKSGPIGEAGYKGGGTAQAKQPSGHKGNNGPKV